MYGRDIVSLDMSKIVQVSVGFQEGKRRND